MKKVFLSVLLSFALLVAAVFVVCQIDNVAFKSGVVTSKGYIPAYWEYLPSGDAFVPVYHDEMWFVVIEDMAKKGRTRLIAVDKQTFEEADEGSIFPKENRAGAEEDGNGR